MRVMTMELPVIEEKFNGPATRIIITLVIDHLWIDRYLRCLQESACLFASVISIKWYQDTGHLATLLMNPRTIKFTINFVHVIIAIYSICTISCTQICYSCDILYLLEWSLKGEVSLRIVAYKQILNSFSHRYDTETSIQADKLTVAMIVVTSTFRVFWSSIHVCNSSNLLMQAG